MVENTDVENFYTLYETDANGGCCLNDSNTWRKIQGNNGYYGVLVLGTQSDINDIVEPTITATIAIDSELSRQVNVRSGNLSAPSAAYDSFGLSGISTLSSVGIPAGTTYYFTATVGASGGGNGSGYIPNVYNSYTIATADFVLSH